MGASRSVLFERLSAMSYDRRTEQQKSSKSAKRVFKPNRRAVSRRRLRGAMIDLHGWTEVDAGRGVI
jgi:hypothetical protein